MRKDILASPYKEYFLDINIEDTFFLDGEDAEIIWDKYIEDKASSYLKLNEDNWLIKGKQELITKWLDDFNSNNNDRMKLLLRNDINWQGSNIWFCLSKKIIIESTWNMFTKYWDWFLLCDDEFPIVVNNSKLHQGLVFTPIGGLLLIDNN